MWKHFYLQTRELGLTLQTGGAILSTSWCRIEAGLEGFLSGVEGGFQVPCYPSEWLLLSSLDLGCPGNERSLQLSMFTPGFVLLSFHFFPPSLPVLAMCFPRILMGIGYFPASLPLPPVCQISCFTNLL